MTRPRRRWAWAAILAALVALGAWFPARWAWIWLGPRYPQVDVGAVSGSIWNGHADDVVAAGWAVGRVDWRLARSLLFGRVRLSIRARGTWGTGEGALRRRADGSLEGDNLRLVLSPAAVLPPALFGGLLPRGTIDGEFEHWQLRNGWPVALRGRLVWHDARLGDGDSSVASGTWRADVAGVDGMTLEATLHDVDDAPVALAGTIDATPLGWRVDAMLTPRDVDADARRLLRRWGSPDARGSFRVRLHGGLVAPPASR